MNTESHRSDGLSRSEGMFAPPVCLGLQLVLPTRGYSIRTVITGTKTNPTAAFAAAKGARTHYVDCETEYLAVQASEIDPTHVECRTQPFLIAATTSAGTFKSIPDMAIQRSSGRWDLVECKRDWHAFQSVDAQKQAWLARLAADALGADYRQVVHSNVSGSVLLHNMELIIPDRFVNVNPNQEHNVRRMLSAHGPMPLGRLLPSIDNCPITARACAHALIVRRVIAFNMDQRLTDESVIELIARPTGPLPDLLAHAGTPANTAFEETVAA